jgi:hypothetical protein
MDTAERTLEPARCHPQVCRDNADLQRLSAKFSDPGLRDAETQRKNSSLRL